ncbi:DnaB-like helicase C-terminal domain-containing protein, partial [Streptococcus pyogenes]
KVESRQIEIAQYSRALKMLAKELDCPVVVVVQLSRQAEMNGAPRLHHLRESGALEQDADKVLLLSRSDGGDLTVDLAKNRSGQLGSVELTP